MLRRLLPLYESGSLAEGMGIKMVVPLGLEPRLGADLAHTVYKAVGAALHYETVKWRGADVSPSDTLRLGFTPPREMVVLTGVAPARIAPPGFEPSASAIPATRRKWSP